MTARRIKWGIAGLGNIAHRFARDLTGHVANGELYAVAARDKDRAEEFGRKYDSKKVYGSYKALAQDHDLEAVYVATIHPFHKEIVKLFLEHGKHVLVEKPAFTNSQDWKNMSKLANSKGLLLLEAMKVAAFPAYRELREFITTNRLKLTSIEAAFGNWHEFDPAWHLFNPKLSGGATLDVGVYGLWLFSDLSTLRHSKIPKPIAFFDNDNTESLVDENAKFIFDGEIKGKIEASITRNLKREAVIKGPDLEITIHDKWWNPRTIDITYRGDIHRICPPIRGGGFEYETEHFCSLILNNRKQSSMLSTDISQTVTKIMETALVESGYDYLTK